MNKVIFGLLLITILGCGRISDKGVKDAYTVCQEYGGLIWISPETLTVTEKFDVKCKDGTLIRVRK
jgi:hypothetical protein